MILIIYVGEHHFFFHRVDEKTVVQGTELLPNSYSGSMLSLCLQTVGLNLNNGPISKIHTSPVFLTLPFSQRHPVRLSPSIWIPPFWEVLSASDSADFGLDSLLQTCLCLPKLALQVWHSRQSLWSLCLTLLRKGPSITLCSMPLSASPAPQQFLAERYRQDVNLSLEHRFLGEKAWVPQWIRLFSPHVAWSWSTS